MNSLNGEGGGGEGLGLFPMKSVGTQLRTSGKAVPVGM
jgi:hypothetical protein